MSYTRFLCINGEKELRIGKQEILKIQNKNEDIVTERDRILEDIIKYYEELDSSQQKVNNRHRQAEGWVIRNVGSKEIPDIALEEIDHALSKMKNNKAPRPDKIIIEMIKEACTKLKSEIANLFDLCLQLNTVPKSCSVAEVVIIHKT